MVTLSDTIQTIFVLSSAWITGCYSGEPEQLPCSTIPLSSTTARTFRYGNGIDPYPLNQQCHTTFQIPSPDLKIRLSVTKIHCDKKGDILRIHEDSSNLCCDGCTLPLKFENTSAVSVRFSSDSTRALKELGFIIAIIVGKDESKCSTLNNAIDVGTTPVIITSPNFPNNYPLSVSCSYIIRSSNPATGLALSFDFINLDFEGTCYDAIILREDDENGKIIKKICDGYDKGNFALPDNENYNVNGQLYLKFTSDDVADAYGFRVTIRQASAATEAQTSVTSTIPPSTPVSLTTTTKTETSLSTTATLSTVDPSTAITTASQTTSSSTETLETTSTTAILDTSITNTEASATTTTTITPTTAVSLTTTMDQTTTMSLETTTTSTTELPSTTKSHEGVPASGLNSYFTETTIIIFICLIVFMIAIISCVTVFMCIIYVRKKKLKRKRCSQKIFEDDLKFDSHQMSSLYLSYWSAR